MSQTSFMTFAMVRRHLLLLLVPHSHPIFVPLELGILVWQDFQFACGIYPAHESFVASVAAEAGEQSQTAHMIALLINEKEDNVRRLRHHPSLALFCGNNEDYQQIFQWSNYSPAYVGIR